MIVGMDWNEGTKSAVLSSCVFILNFDHFFLIRIEKDHSLGTVKN